MRDPIHAGEAAPEDLRWLRALAARLVRDPHLAEDAVQETLLAAFTRPSPAPEQRRGWLASVLRNALRQEWRARARRAAREEGVAGPEPAHSPLEALAELDLHRRLADEVRALDEPYRTVIVLRFLRERDSAAIARELGVPEKTVRTRLERALARLRERMGRDRAAWLLMLAPPPAASIPLLSTSLLAMKPIASAALLAVVLVGALVLGGAFERSAPSPLASTPPATLVTGEGPRIADAPPAGLALGRESTPAGLAHASVSPGAPRLRGCVRDFDGRGVGRVAVVFERGGEGHYAAEPDGPRAESAPDGSFELAVPEPAGRLNVRSREHVALVRPHLTGSAPAEPPVVVVARAQHYGGIVLDEANAPVEGARVEITLAGDWVRSRDVGGTAVHFLLPFAETRTDERGAFVFEAAGWIEGAELTAAADGRGSVRAALPPSSADDLVLRLAAEPSDLRTIHGLVLDALGALAAGAEVSLGGDAVRADALGRFTLACEPWRTAGWLRALRAGSLPAEISFEQALRPSSPAHPIEIVLGESPRSIRGTVRDAGGEPVEGAVVWTPDTTPFGTVVIQQGEHTFAGQTVIEARLAGEDRGPWAMSVSARTDAEGRFALTDLLDRPYAVFALDARTLEGCGPVECMPGEEHARLVLPRESLVPLAGCVRSRSNVPLAGVSVALGRSLPWARGASTEARGWSSFPVTPPGASWSIEDTSTVTDEEGRFALPPSVVEGSYLRLHGRALALGTSYQLADARDLGALEVVVDASSRFRVIARPDEADAFALENLTGETLPLYLEVEGVTISAASAGLDSGRSGLVLAEEGEVVVVLTSGGTEVRRARLFLPAGGPHELAP